MNEWLEDELMAQLESSVNIIDKIVEVLINSEKYRNSQEFLSLLDKINKISVSW